MSSNYSSYDLNDAISITNRDLIKREAGKSTQEYIQSKIMDTGI
ncbi:hypothetical protein PBAL39_15079 [Pedobacter sp. BAL39]|nr:hypothetical protein PBAL39_15079 [Pedobacter sp. BAL39]